MFPETDTKFPSEVELEIQSVFHEMFPDADRYFVQKVFTWANACFTGQYRDYQAIDARYHDFEHTLQGALCLARLLYRRHAVSAIPVLPQKMFELGITSGCGNGNFCPNDSVTRAQMAVFIIKARYSVASLSPVVLW